MKVRRFILTFILLALTVSTAAAIQATPKILEFLPNPDTPNDLGEYVTIYNPNPAVIDISGVRLTDLEGNVTIPKETFLEPGSVYTIELPEGGVALRNSGDEVILLDDCGRVLDCAIYGESGYKGAGWSGVGLGKALEERIFRRFYPDQDTDTAYEWLPQREYLRGQSNFLPAQRRISCNITGFVSPDCSLDILCGEIENASTLRANLYLFESREIEKAVLDLLERGGEVYLLIEGDPVGGISDAELSILENVIERGGEVRLTGNGLYRLNHAKYALIDRETVIIGSENWNDGGFPYKTSGGNRGWGVVIENEEVFEDLLKVFEFDWERGFVLSSEDTPRSVEEDSANFWEGFWHREHFDPAFVSGNFTVSLIIAPDNSLHHDTIIGMIESANETIYIEEAYIRRKWGEYENPYLLAAIMAARRGVDVKILVDSTWYNLDSDNDNDELCRYLNDIARDESLNLEARLARINGVSKIHNKGVVVDAEKVLISSINWNKNSPISNREVGIIIENPEIGAYYSDVFLRDWERSGTSFRMVLILLVMLLMLGSAVYFMKKWIR
ncbi:MAG: phospholipase D-like domain-containing protein [Candidatus Syntropharchaeales archaeon]